MMEMFRDKKIMVVVAHPDDELLGPGATIHRLIREFGPISLDEWENEGGSTPPAKPKNRFRIKVVILGEGLTARGDVGDTDEWEAELRQHRQNISDAQQILGYHELSIHEFPDNKFDSVPLLDIIKVVEHEKKNFDPDIIFTHHGGDVNIDHQLTFQAVMTATRPVEDEKVAAVITFETPSGTEWIPSTDPRQFTPNLFINVKEEDVEAKVGAMECYKYEKRDYPHPRSPEALQIRAQYWGMAVGTPFAEPFCTVRIKG